MNLRKRRAVKAPASMSASPTNEPPDSHHIASSLTLAATQILDDLNNTQPTNQRRRDSGVNDPSSPFSDSIANTAVLHPKGILSVIYDFFWPHHQLSPPPSYDISNNITYEPKSRTASVNNQHTDVMDNDSSLQPSATSSKASTPQIKKKHLATTLSCPGNMGSTRKTNKKGSPNINNRQGIINIDTANSKDNPTHEAVIDPVVYTNNKPKPKISAQSSVNDECESSSVSSSSSTSSGADNSTAEDFLVVTCAGGQDTQPEVVGLSSEFPGQDASGKKKKKKNKADEPPTKETRQTVMKPKKKDKSTDAKSDKQDSLSASDQLATNNTTGREGKDKTSFGSSSSTTPRSATPASPRSATPVSPPPVAKQKQEAKVRGVPKDNNINSSGNMHGGRGTSSPNGGSEQQQLRRQQSLPTYEKPPRLQQAAATRMESYNGGYGRSTPPSHLQDATATAGFPASQHQQPSISTPTTRAEPPRAIIFPEPKREAPVNQFGAIGCKVPVQQQQNNPSNNQQASGHNNSWAKSGNNSNAPAGGNNSQQTSELGLTPSSLTNSLPGLIPGVAAPSASGLSIMQELQAERRHREQEFRRNNPSAPQWPGFGPEPVSGMMRHRTDYLESLWDSHAAPTSSAGTAPVVAANPSNAAAMLGRWGTIGQNLWPSNQLSQQQQIAAGYTLASVSGLPPTSIPPPQMTQQQVMAAVVSQNGGNMMTSGFGGVSAVANMHSSPPPPQPHQQLMNASNAMYGNGGGTPKQNDMDLLSIANIWAKSNNSNSGGASGSGVNGSQRKDMAPPSAGASMNSSWSAALFSSNKNKDL
jgi:hypothetical protein